MTMKTMTSFFLILVMLSLAYFLLSCTNQPSIYPTKNFYINDYADVLSDGTITNIEREGSRLFETTDSYVNGGTMLIVNTILVDHDVMLNVYDVDLLLDKWAIGFNRMGLVVNLYFAKQDDQLELLYETYAISEKLQRFITEQQLDLLFDKTLYNSNWNQSKIDIPVMHMYYELLESVYMHVYDYISFIYDLEIFELYINNFQSVEETSNKPMTYFDYMLYQIGVDNEIIVITYFILTILLISLSMILIHKERNLTILKRKPKEKDQK